MPGSRSSTEIVLAIVIGVLLAATALPGCVTVRPEEREFLADPAMTFGGEGPDAQAAEEHVLSNREGSYGGAGGVTGGGCGCN